MNTRNFEDQVKKSIEASIEVKQNLLRTPSLVPTIAKASELVFAAFHSGKKLFLCGNGGSAADAQHIAAEFVGRFAYDRPPMPAIALSVNTSCVTALGNDYGFDQVFSRQLEALARPGDVLIGISTSGNSANVINAMVAAKKMGVRPIALSGRKGGKLKDVTEICLCAPSDETPRIQECHILIGHIIAQLAEASMYPTSTEAAIAR